MINSINNISSNIITIIYKIIYLYIMEQQNLTKSEIFVNYCHDLIKSDYKADLIMKPDTVLFAHMKNQYGNIYTIKKTEGFGNNNSQEDIKKKLEEYLFYLRQTRPNMN